MALLWLQPSELLILLSGTEVVNLYTAFVQRLNVKNLGVKCPPDSAPCEVINAKSATIDVEKIQARKSEASMLRMTS